MTKGLRRGARHGASHARAIGTVSVALLNQQAAQSLASGRVDDAIAIFERALRLSPASAALWVNAGFAYRTADRLDQSYSAYSRALALQPDLAEAYFQRAIVLKRLGKYAEARDGYLEALRKSPGHSGALLNLSNLYVELGQADEAAAGYRKLLDRDPRNLAALEALARLLVQQGHDREARGMFQKALECAPGSISIKLELATLCRKLNDPHASLKLLKESETTLTDNADIKFLIADLLNEIDQYAEALSYLAPLLSECPDSVEYLRAQASALNGLKRFDEAFAVCERLMELKPDALAGWNNRGSALLGLKRFDEAIASFERAIEIDPLQADLHNNLGNALREACRWDKALLAISEAIRLRPDYADAFYNRAVVWGDLNQHNKCIADYERAIAIKPDHAEAHFNVALCHLQHGDFDAGWREYEWRWQQDFFRSMRRNFREPLWDGTQSLAGKTIVLHGEQGLGDSIQFAALVGRVKALGANVILEVPAPLHGLFHSLAGVDRLIDRGGETLGADLHCPLMSVPRALGLKLDDLPAAIGYLRASTPFSNKWSLRLSSPDRPRIGVVWSGNPKHANDHYRSLPLSELLGALPEGPLYVSLQRDVNANDEIFLAESRRVIHFGHELADFQDTAALCASMDLIISVDTSVAHLAGAMGRPTWVLLPFNPDFRWMLGRDDSPWYPSVRLFRQARHGDWSGALERLAAALDGRVFP